MESENTPLSKPSYNVTTTKILTSYIIGLHQRVPPEIFENCIANSGLLQHSGNNFLYFPCSDLSDIQRINDLLSTNFKA